MKTFFQIRKKSNIELYDLSQCNSEHARHWFFNGRFKFNGKELKNIVHLIDLKNNTK